MSPAPDRLADTCQFCGSRLVVKQSLQHKFEQPDLIVPFTVSQEAAHQAAIKALTTRPFWKGLWQRAPRQLTQLELGAAYLPFWLFSGAVKLVSSVNRKFDGMVLVTDVPYFAGAMPSRSLVEAIEPFDLGSAVGYDPHLLGEYPAQLYVIDLDRAALDVRPRLHKVALAKTLKDHVSPMTFDISYRLALLPIWTLNAAGVDGEACQGVINGQTGKLRLSKWQDTRS
jgi:hypothetical protein